MCARREFPRYLAVAASPDGNVAPTPGQIANSSQQNCILYYNQFNPNHRSSLRWNTILSTFHWYDIRDFYCPQNPPGPCPPPGQAARDLMARILGCVLPIQCQQAPNPMDLDSQMDALPARTLLHQNVPNTFNPTTAIRFDLSHSGRVELDIFDVSGHRVRKLVDGPMQARRNHTVIWNGLDDTGQRVPSGVYLYRLITGEVTAVRKMIVMR